MDIYSHKLCFAALFVYSKKGVVSNFFERSIFVVLAQFCLAVYLTHGAVMMIFSEVIQEHHQWMTENKSIVIAAVLFCCCLLGFFAHYAIEKNIGRWLRDKLE